MMLDLKNAFEILCLHYKVMYVDMKMNPTKVFMCIVHWQHKFDIWGGGMQLIKKDIHSGGVNFNIGHMQLT